VKKLENFEKFPKLNIGQRRVEEGHLYSEMKMTKKEKEMRMEALRRYRSKD